ncbi:MAG TPA: orotate phosphoribosyltransferase [Fibrobacteraceae bacterium]|nr:orotate phosphoribosyltransferase [Fibrobacteraceae bacterium]
MTDHSSFVHFLVQAGALRFGDFTTKSGRKTPYFINTGEFRSGKTIAELACWYASAFQSFFGNAADNLYGPAYKGIPLCATTAMALQQQFGRDLSFTYNRKEAKDHGEGGVLVGDTYKAPRKVVIIEDVITAGTSVRETLELLRGIPNAQVVGLLVSVDRQERLENGLSALAQVEQEYGIRAKAIISIADIIAYLEDADHRSALGLGNDILERVRAYRNEWGA